MDLEGTTLNEISKTKKDKDHDFVLKNKTNKQSRNRLIDTENTLMAAQGEEVGGMGKAGEGTERNKLPVIK